MEPQFLSLVERNQHDNVKRLSELQPNMGPLAYTTGYDNSETEQGAAIQINPTSVPDVWAKPPAASQFQLPLGDDQGVLDVTAMPREECTKHGHCGHYPQ